MSDTALTRRWLDKALLGAIAATVTLGGIVYGMMARGVDDAKRESKEVREIQQNQDKRITITEEAIRTLQRDTTEIKGDVKDILREVKK